MPRNDTVVPGRSRSGYLPGLDGWRCLAILGVMWAHDARRIIFGHTTANVQGMGGFGVELFFAISGVLIAWRIQQDEAKTGFFSLKSFYIRRFFRIQPPQWVFLAVVGLFLAFHWIAGKWKFWFGALFLYENYLWHNVNRAQIVQASYLVGHFWTLAVEEHFYLLISLFFFVVKRRRILTLGVCLGALILAQYVLKPHLYSDDVSDRRTFWVIQYLLFAAWASLTLRNPSVMAWIKQHFQPWKAYLLTAVLMYGHSLWHGATRLHLSIVYSEAPTLFYCFTGWVIATMLHPESWTTRLLELAPLRFVGRISYSLYLWHLFLFGGGAAERCSLQWLTWSNQSEIMRFGFAFGIACLSYFFVEKPMIRLGHRLAPPATPGHRDLQVTGMTSAQPRPSEMPLVGANGVPMP